MPKELSSRDILHRTVARRSECDRHKLCLHKHSAKKAKDAREMLCIIASSRLCSINIRVMSSS